jgi:membrane protease subunit HflC
MNPQIKILAPVGLAALALVIYASAFIVNQWEVAIKLRLGEIVDSEYKPGLHFMVPVINNVKTFDARIQTHDSRPQRFLTVEKKDVIVDYYAKWRITNPGQFYRSTGGDSTRTARLLAERINTGLRDEFGRRTIQEVVSEDRYQLMDELTKEADRQASELGIEVVDVRVKKIDLPPEVSESVYERMRAERERVARDLRAKGGEAAERIRADADRQRTVIIADAYKVAEEARGEGDARPPRPMPRPTIRTGISTASTAVSMPIAPPSAKAGICWCCSPIRISSVISIRRTLIPPPRWMLGARLPRRPHPLNQLRSRLRRRPRLPFGPRRPLRPRSQPLPRLKALSRSKCRPRLLPRPRFRLWPRSRPLSRPMLRHRRRRPSQEQAPRRLPSPPLCREARRPA